MKKSFKTVLTLSLIGLLSFGLVACSSSSETPSTETSSTETSSIVEKDTWVIGIDDTFAPLGFRDTDGNLTGYDIDLANAMCEKLDKEVIFQPIDWSMKEAELNSGNIDLIWNGYTITPERQEKVDFSLPYLDNKQVIVVAKDSTIQSKADLAGKKVGAQSESSAVTAMEKEGDLYSSFDGGQAITYEDNNQALMDLDNGRIDAVVADEVVIRYYVNLKGNDQYRILDEDFGSEEYGVGFRKGDILAVETFNETYQSLKEDGTLATLSDKWFGRDISK